VSEAEQKSVINRGPFDPVLGELKTSRTDR
jgi:hypothetical protein